MPQALAGAMLETWRDDVARARPAAAASIDAYLRDPVGGDPRRGRRLRARRAGRQADRPSRRTPRLRRAAGRAWRRGRRRAAPLSPDRACATISRDLGPASSRRADRRRHRRRHDRRRQGRPGHRRRRQHRRADRRGRRERQAEGAGGAHRQPRRVGDGVRSASARRSSTPRPRGCRWSPRWAMSRRRAAIGWRRPADVIFAEPSTITGSIGVFGILPSFQGSMAKLGHRRRRGQDDAAVGRARPAQRPLARRRRADPGRGRQHLPRFLGHRRAVARARARPRSTASRQGRVWDGGTARQLGLVDRFGGLDEAIAKAAALAKIDDDAA